MKITKYIKLAYASFPLSNYLINDNNNFLVIDETKITLTNGNYNISELVAHI